MYLGGKDLACMTLPNNYHPRKDEVLSPKEIGGRVIIYNHGMAKTCYCTQSVSKCIHTGNQTGQPAFPQEPE